MRVQSRNKYDSPARRKQLAELLAILTNCGGFEPYKPNTSDDFYWTVDAGNNWKVKFFHEDPYAFELIYRYQCAGNRYEESLFIWLTLCMSGLKPAEPDKFKESLEPLFERITND